MGDARQNVGFLMHIGLAAVAGLLATGVVSQDLTNLCTVSPTGCTIGATACPTGCLKSARCQNPCPAQKTTVVTYTSRTTVVTTAPATTVKSTVTKTKTVSGTPTVKPATCAAQVPYINLFTFVDQACSTLVDPEFDLLCFLNDPQVNYTFAGTPNKLNSPTLQKIGDIQYPASECVKLAVQDSRSAYFTIDGVDGTNATSADCRVVLFAEEGCTGVADSYNINKANFCQSIPDEDPPWKSAHFECSLMLGPA